MANIGPVNINFLRSFSEEYVVPDFYEGVVNKMNKKPFVGYRKTQNPLTNFNPVAVNFIPSFVDLQIKQRMGFDFFEVDTHYGFLADFDNHESFQEYFKGQMNAKRRKSLRSQLKKLDNSGAVYKFYVGNIDKGHYNFLFDQLEQMINARFKQRGGKHSSIPQWSFYKESGYKMILEARACLFAIYIKDKPIAISMNYLHQNIFFGVIDSYDLSYAKYSPGNILILKKMEWCFQNGFSSFDMGYGYLKYKYEWCNTIYKCKSQVFYKKENLLARGIALWLSKTLLVKIMIMRAIGNTIYHEPSLSERIFMK